MKKILTFSAILGFILFFVAASASDAGVISFGWVLFIAGSGCMCLLISFAGLRYCKIRAAKLRNVRALSITKERCAASQVG